MSAPSARHSSRPKRLRSRRQARRLLRSSGGSVGAAIEIDRKPERHADAGGGEAVVPAELLAERAADERRQERAEIDADIEDREGAVAARIAGRVERADLGRDVGLERAVAEDEDGRARTGTAARTPS